VASAFETLTEALRKLPGLGSRSAERLAIHLLAERPEKLTRLVAALQGAAATIHRCPVCGNLTESNLCTICDDASRDATQVCIVESVSDLMAIEKSGAWRGVYHVLNGKLSPLKGVGPDSLNLASLEPRFQSGELREVLFALSNDIEGEATCHYIQERWLATSGLIVSRIGFGLPSGGDIPYADITTLRSALESRKGFL
jgi:recombination protein RecR